MEDAFERAIEAHVASASPEVRPTGAAVGQVLYGGQAVEQYVDFLASCFHASFSLPLRVGLDCANGAASQVALQLFEQLGITVHAWNIAPDGLNINQDCGAVSPGFLQHKVRAEGLDVGFAFDGDADRLIAIDHLGNVLDGDNILAICAGGLQGYVADNARVIVGTVMSNLGLEHTLQKMGFAVP